MNTDHISKNWYVVKCLSRMEGKVSERLTNKGIRCYLPLYSSVRQWSDRKKTISLPLVPGFVFIHCTRKELLQVYGTPGVFSLLYEFNQPAIVRAHEIDNLQILEKEYHGEVSTPADALEFEAGEDVFVCKGPFKGLYARAMEEGSKYRLCIRIDLVQASFTLNVPKSFVQKVQEKRA